MAIVLMAVALSLALPLREFVAQRGRLADLTERADASRQRVAELQAAKERWADPSFVAAQARTRLHYVMPGEVGYLVLEPDATTPSAAGTAAAPRPADSWYGTLWGSVTRR